MHRYVKIILFSILVSWREVGAPSPMRLTIDCGSYDGIKMVVPDVIVNKNCKTMNNKVYKNTTIGKELSDSQGNSILNLKPPSLFNDQYDVDSFCQLIHRAIPKAVKDGKFILIEPDMDQSGFSDTLSPVAVAPPQGFAFPRLGSPKLGISKLRIPKIGVPKLRPNSRGPLDRMGPPTVGSAMNFPARRSQVSPVMMEEESSAERMDRLKKGIQKMLHFVKVLGQFDKYLTERTRIIFDKISKTIAE